MKIQAQDKPILFFLLLYFAVLIWSGIGPRDYFTWLLEIVPALIALAVLAATFKKFRFSNLVYFLITLECIILMIGGHTTYAEMPLFNWLSDTFDLARNYYDRLGHFAQGFVPVMIVREIIIRKNLIPRRGWQAFFAVFTVLGFSAGYEFFEWGIAKLSGSAADAFLGTQGDVWDTQWDMFLCFIGSLSALLTLSGFHDKALVPFLKNDARPGADRAMV